MLSRVRQESLEETITRLDTKFKEFRMLLRTHHFKGIEAQVKSVFGKVLASSESKQARRVA